MAEEYDIDLTEEEEEGQSASGDSPIDQEATPDDPIDSDDDGKADDDGSVDDDAERNPDGYIVDPSTDGGTPGSEPVEPVPDPEPEPEYAYVAVVTEEVISDYSALSIERYRSSGATAIAVYDDGTEEAIPWNEVVDPAGPGADAASEADAVAKAINQHFWHRATDPGSDGAGTGAFVTDVEQDAFLEQAAGGWPDWQPEQYDSGGQERADYKPFHNLLQNSQGILLRSALRRIAAFTHSAVTFFDGLGNAVGNIVARFGKDGFMVGRETESHLVGDYHSLQLRDLDGTTYFHVSDLRDRDGNADITATFTGDGANRLFSLPLQARDTNYTVTVSDSSGGAAESIEKTRYTFQFAQAPTDGALITAEFVTRDTRAKAYTVGVRGSGYVGAMSYTEGNNCVASGNFSHAEGSGGTTASGQASHAEGQGTTASGYASHAEGSGTTASDRASHAEGSGTTAGNWNSHAEGRDTTASGNGSHSEGQSTTASGGASHAEGSSTTASGSMSHAEGFGTVASGNISHAEGRGTTAEGICSHAGGFYTIARRDLQTVIGSYNVADTTSALIIGNGNSESTRSNALKVDWNGNVTCGKVNGVDVTAISPSGNYLPLSGGTLTGNLSFGSTGKNINMVDGSGFSYPALRDNGSNLWIGATATAAQHHKGGTYISSGHDGSAGKPTIYVSVPNAANTNATNYGVYHTGNKPALTDLSGVLDINNGGTGSAGISISTGASLVTSSSAATVTACSLSKWGPLACLSVTFTPKSSWANGAQLKVGTVALPANRPTTQVGGGAAGITAGCSPAGSIFANNHTGAARTASTTLAFVYLSDI